jgi:hypothetical protein
MLYLPFAWLDKTRMKEIFDRLTLINKNSLVHDFLLVLYIYIFQSLQVSGNYGLINRRNNCVYVTLGTCLSVWMTVWCAGAPCAWDSCGWKAPEICYITSSDVNLYVWFSSYFERFLVAFAKLRKATIGLVVSVLFFRVKQVGCLWSGFHETRCNSKTCRENSLFM